MHICENRKIKLSKNKSATGKTGRSWLYFKWRNYDPSMGRFFNIDPLSEKFPYNSTYVFQENKLGMGVELEGLELLKNHTGFFAIHGGEMQVKRAPISQTRIGQDGNRYATFTAGDIGLSTSGYNPNGDRVSTGNTGLRLNEYKYNEPTPSGAKMESVRGDDRPNNIWTKTYDKSLDNAGKLNSGIKELYKLGELVVNIPDAFKSSQSYVQASDYQAMTEGLKNWNAATTPELADSTNNTQVNRTQINIFIGRFSNDNSFFPNGNINFNDMNARLELANSGRHGDLHTAGGIQYYDKDKYNNALQEGSVGKKLTAEQRSDMIQIIEEIQHASE